MRAESLLITYRLIAECWFSILICSESVGLLCCLAYLRHPSVYPGITELTASPVFDLTVLEAPTLRADYPSSKPKILLSIGAILHA